MLDDRDDQSTAGPYLESKSENNKLSTPKSRAEC